MEKEINKSQLKVAIVGAESSGKTTLCDDLANEFNCCIVKEYAREYLESQNLKYSKEDLLFIAQGQYNSEQKCINSKSALVISDTSVLSVVVWSIIKYGDCDHRIIEINQNQKYDLVFLTDCNIPWEFDPMRESPDENKRKNIQQLFLKYLSDSNSKYHILRGDRFERLQEASELIKELQKQIS